MVKNWLKYLWPDTYIVFIQSPEGINATQYVVRENNVEIVDESSFLIEKEALSKECIEYIEEFLSVYPQTQLIYMTAAASCSAVATCSKSDMADLDVDISIIKSICKEDFSSYISVMDLENDNLLFKPFKLDYLFSPFFVMDEVKTGFFGTMLLVLHMQNRLYVAVYKDNKLIYADNIHFSDEEGFDKDIEGTSEEIIEDLDADFDLDDLGDFEDELDDLDDFDDDIENMDDDLEEDDEVEDTQSLSQDDTMEDELGEYDLHFFESLKNVIKTFYENEKVESDFIEHIQMLDTVALGENIIDLVKEELFCEVDVRHIDLHKECLNLAIKEDA
jgi:hypothetical protein